MIKKALIKFYDAGNFLSDFSFRINMVETFLCICATRNQLEYKSVDFSFYSHSAQLSHDILYT